MPFCICHARRVVNEGSGEARNEESAAENPRAVAYQNLSCIPRLFVRTWLGLTYLSSMVE